jgi:hypothetical protein
MRIIATATGQRYEPIQCNVKIHHTNFQRVEEFFSLLSNALEVANKFASETTLTGTIAISKDGINLSSDQPRVFFRRTYYMRPLPVPETRWISR